MRVPLLSELLSSARKRSASSSSPDLLFSSRSEHTTKISRKISVILPTNGRDHGRPDRVFEGPRDSGRYGEHMCLISQRWRTDQFPVAG